MSISFARTSFHCIALGEQRSFSTQLKKLLIFKLTTGAICIVYKGQRLSFSTQKSLTKGVRIELNSQIFRHATSFQNSWLSMKEQILIRPFRIYRKLLIPKKPISSENALRPCWGSFGRTRRESGSHEAPCNKKSKRLAEVIYLLDSSSSIPKLWSEL